MHTEWSGTFSLRDTTLFPKFTVRFLKWDIYGEVLADLHREPSGKDWDVFMGDENVALLLGDDKAAVEPLTDSKLWRGCERGLTYWSYTSLYACSQLQAC